MSWKSAIRSVLARAGYTVIRSAGLYHQDGLLSIHDETFRNDAAFRRAYERGVKASGHDPQFEWRVHIALWAAARALDAKGDFVECGVNAGFHSSAIMESLRWSEQGRRFFLIDTFRGPVLEQFSAAEIAVGRLAAAKDALAGKRYVTDVDRVKANYAEWRNAIVIPGVIPEVLETLPVDRVAFLHIDLNCAYPERAALEFFWPRLSDGGVVLLDDYGYVGHQEQRDVMRETVRRLGGEILALPTGQGIVVKNRISAA